MNKNLLIFLLERKDYDQGSLDNHLAYLSKWGGTPDCMDSVDVYVDGYNQMVEEIKKDGVDVAVVDEATLKLLETHTFKDGVHEHNSIRT